MPDPLPTLESGLRAVVFYKPTCPPCRLLSRLVVWLALGHLRRVPITAAEAAVLYAEFPERRGQLMLRDGERVWFQRRVFLAIPRMIVRTWWRLGQRLTSRLIPRTRRFGAQP